MNLDPADTIITTPLGYVQLVRYRVHELKPDAYSVRVYAYSADGLGDELLSIATAERDSDARLIAQTLAHEYICEDCQRAPISQH